MQAALEVIPPGLPAQDPAAIRLEWFDVDAADSLLFDALAPEERAEALKWKALDRFGIRPQAGETPLDSYIRWLHAINGLAYSKPEHRDITEALTWNAGAMHFVFFLAGGRPYSAQAGTQ